MVPCRVHTREKEPREANGAGEWGTFLCHWRVVGQFEINKKVFFWRGEGFLV